MTATLYYERRAPRPSKPAFAELADVTLTREAVTDDGLTVPAGTQGTIVGIWSEGEAYEVEFAAFGLATVESSAVRAS